MENNNNNTITFTLSSNNIRFPLYSNSTLLDNLYSSTIKFETLQQELNKLIFNITEFEIEYIDIIVNNINDFNIFSNLYNKKTTDYIMISKSIKILISSIINKLNKTEEQNDNLDLSFPYFKYDNFGLLNLIKNQYEFNVQQSEIHKKILNIFQYIKTIRNTNKLPPTNFFTVCLKYLVIFYKKMYNNFKSFHSLTNFKSNINNENDIQFDNEIKLFNLLILLQKIENVAFIINNAYFIDENDIENFDEKSNEWNLIKKYLFRVIPSNKDLIQNEFKIFLNNIYYMQAIIQQCFISNNFYYDCFKAAILSIKYNFNKKLPEYDAIKCQVIYNERNLLVDFYKLSKRNLIKFYEKFKFPSIEFRKKLYLKREFNEITILYIKTLLQKVKENKFIKKEEKKNFFETKNNEFDIKIENANEINLHDTDLKISNKNSYTDSVSKNNKQDYVSITLLNYTYIKLTKENLFSCNCSSSIQPNHLYETLIIHIHGGSFIGSSTYTHEAYLREWANKFKVPIIGINYNLSPENQYPQALNDCYQAYCWIINHSINEFNINPKKIILSGDCSGGNLCIALTYLIICINEFENKNIKVPDLILSEFPICNLNIKNISLSMILTMEDFLYNNNFINYCFNSYVGNYNFDEDFFLNIWKINSEYIIKKLPKIRILIGSNDPFRNDCIRLINNLKKVKEIDLKVYDLENYGHEFFEFYIFLTDVLKEIPNKMLCNEIE